MEQLTLSDAAENYAKQLLPEASNSNLVYRSAKADFKAGAEWQKEQYSPLFEEIEIVIRYLNSIGATEYANDLKVKAIII